MVEHNLAKVGVASSNLVSRSIFFIIFFPLFLFSSPVIIQSEYCADSDYFELIHIDPTTGKNFQLFKLPSSSFFQIPYLRIESILKDNDIKSIDNSGGIVKIIKQCTTNEDFVEVAQAIEEAFINNYKSITINSLVVSPVNSLPNDFSELSFESIRVSASILRSGGGSIGAVYVSSAGAKRTINFRFALNATISGFKAKNNLSNGKILALNDIEPVELILDKFASMPLEEFEPNSLVVRHFVKEGSLLFSKSFDRAKLVRKRDLVDLVIEDGGLSIVLKAEALDDGNVDENIRVKTTEGKNFVGRVISKNRVVAR